MHNPRRNSWATLLHPRTLLSRTDPGTARGGDAADLESANGRGSWRELELEKFGELGLTLDAEEDAHEGPELRFSTDNGDELHVSAEEAPRVGRPFSRWMRTLQRRAEQRSSEQGDDGAQDPQFLGHRKSSSDCSFDYVTRVRSASVSISGSAITRSRRNTARSSQYAMTNRSSRTSLAASRHSEDSIRLERTPLDHAIAERLLQRRRILEELIHTEEGYIGDIKFLMNVRDTGHANGWKFPVLANILLGLRHDSGVSAHAASGPAHFDQPKPDGYSRASRRDPGRASQSSAQLGLYWASPAITSAQGSRQARQEASAS